MSAQIKPKLYKDVYSSQIRPISKNAQDEITMNKTANSSINKNNSPVSAVSTIVHNNGKVLLILRSNQPFKNMWSLPGGKQEFGEKLKEAALRELNEETGLIAQHAKFIKMYEEIGRNKKGETQFHINICVFRVDEIEGIAKAGDDAVAVMWANKADLQKLDMTPNTADIIIKELEECLT